MAMFDQGGGCSCGLYRECNCGQDTPTKKREIFVFGSNEAGRHGAGAAAYAVNEHGAIYGQGVGLQGNSYAIPSKDKYIQTLPLIKINRYVNNFIDFAIVHSELDFMVTCIGCGLAGYKVEQIAPMFSIFPKNVILPRPFQIYFKGEYYDKRGFEHST